MSEKGPKPIPDSLHSEEALRERRDMYDAARRLFDTSNHLGLRVSYIEGETARPHNSDRIINAQFDAAMDDSISYGGFPAYMRTRSRERTLDVCIMLYSANPRLRFPDGIDLQIGGYGGVLMPDGSVPSKRPFNDSQADVDEHTVHVQSLFTLFEKALDEGRVKPVPQDFDVNPVKRVKSADEVPDFEINPVKRPPK